jgi:hypothetical protein
MTCLFDGGWFFVEEIDTGLIDGYYGGFKNANSARSHWQKRYPKIKFVVKPKTTESFTIHNSQLLNFADFHLKIKR